MSARSGTEVRRRSVSVNVRFTPGEHARIHETATLLGATLPEFLRSPYGSGPEPVFEQLSREWADALGSET